MTRRAWIAFAAISVLWGGSYLLIEIAERGGMPALDVAWLRVALAAALLLGLAGRAGTLRSLRGRWRWLLAYAVCEVSIPFPMIALGEVHVASSLAAIIVATVPLIGALLALRFDPSERPTPVRAAGLAVGFVGVVALVGLDVGGNGSELLGALAIVLAAVGYAIGPMIIKHGFQGLDTFALMGASLGLATVILAPFAALQLPSGAVTAGAWSAVAALGLFCTALAFVVVTVLIREAGTSRAMVFTYVNPVVALALGVTLEAERPGAGAIVGLVLILVGSWLSTTGRLGRPSRASPAAAASVAPAAGSAPDGNLMRRGTADRLLD